MSSIGTFGSFTQARLAIYASHAGLTVTGNNIANINTAGYTRQKLDQTSFYAGGADRYYSQLDLRVGNGVLATGVSQLRDPYLDIRYRNENASVGAMDAKLSGLEEIQRILDEVGDGEDGFGIISAQFNDFLHQLEQLSDQTGLEEYDIQVRSSAESLCNLFNSYAAQLEEVYNNSVTTLKQDIAEVNTILSNIRDLNSTIRKAEIHGDNALELRDERNVLIDQLSYYMKLNVVYTEEDIGGGTMVEKLTISLDNGEGQVLVDGVYATQLSIPETLTVTETDNVNNTTTTRTVANDNLIVSLGPLLDSKDRPLYTITKDAPTTVGESGLPAGGLSETTTDANGVITITTYTKTNRTQNVVDANGNSTTEAVYIVQTYTKTPSQSIDLGDTDMYGSLQSQREFLTESGEFCTADALADDPGAGVKRGILYYMNALDLLVNQFATTFNEANQGYLYDENGNYVDANGEALKLRNGSTLSKDGLTPEQQAKLIGAGYFSVDADGNRIADLDAYMAHRGVEKVGGVLFSNGTGNETDNPIITASNISISEDWSEGPLIVNSFVKPSDLDKVASTDSSNILHMIALMSTKQDYFASTVEGDAASKVPMFNGDFNEMWVNIGSVLGNDIKSTSTLLDTYYASSVELDTSRDSVSSVDLNDEAMNLMQYSKSYNAACRLMTTLDSVLDKLINGTGMTT